MTKQRLQGQLVFEGFYKGTNVLRYIFISAKADENP